MFFSSVAAVVMVLALALFVPVLIEFFDTGLVPRMPSLMVSVGLMIFSLMSFNSGVTLSVLKRQERQEVERHLTTIRMMNNMRDR